MRRRRIALAALAVLTLSGWEGDDGGLDQWEVQVGRYAERLNNQMQLTTPPAPPPTAPPGPPTFSGASSNGRCTGAIPLLTYYSPGWNVDQFARIMWRESNCRPEVYNSCCHGLLQIHEMHCSRLAAAIGPCNLYDPAYNIRAAAWLYRQAGTSPWEQTR